MFGTEFASANAMSISPVRRVAAERVSGSLFLLVCVGQLQLGCGGDVAPSSTAIAGGTSRVVGSSNMAVGGTSSVVASSSTATGGTSNFVGSSSTATGGTSRVVGSSGASAGSSNGTAISLCYSPTQNLSIAYDTGARGCSCPAGVDADICVSSVALICEGGFWRAVEDGPCMPRAPDVYSPAASSAAGGTSVPSPGTPITAEDDCPSGVALGIIDFASSGWDEGGLCCAPRTSSKRCGARAGNTCTADEYCAYVEGQYCGRADAEATCKPRPGECPASSESVCGCNGKTYANACLAATDGAGIDTMGQCDG